MPKEIDPERYVVPEFEKRSLDDIIDKGRFTNLSAKNANERKKLEDYVSENIETDEKLREEHAAYQLSRMPKFIDEMKEKWGDFEYTAFILGSYGTNEKNIHSDVDVKIVFRTWPTSPEIIKNHLEELSKKLNVDGGHEINLWCAELNEYTNLDNYTSAGVKISKELVKGEKNVAQVIEHLLNNIQHDDWMGLCKTFLAKYEAGTGMILPSQRVPTNIEKDLEDAFNTIKTKQIPIEEAVGLYAVAQRDLVDAVLEEDIAKSNSKLGKALMRAVAALYIAQKGKEDITSYTAIAHRIDNVMPDENNSLLKGKLKLFYKQKRDPNSEKYICENKQHVEPISELINYLDESIERSINARDPNISFFTKLTLTSYFEKTIDDMLNDLDKSPLKDQIVNPGSKKGKLRRKLMVPFFEGIIDFMANRIIAEEDTHKLEETYDKHKELLEILSKELKKPKSVKDDLIRAKLNYVNYMFADSSEEKEYFTEFKKNLDGAEKKLTKTKNEITIRAGRFVDYNSDYHLWRAISHMEDSPTPGNKDMALNLVESLKSNPFNTSVLYLLENYKDQNKNPIYTTEPIIKIIATLGKASVSNETELVKSIKELNQATREMYHNAFSEYFKKILLTDERHLTKKIEGLEKSISEGEKLATEEEVKINTEAFGKLKESYAELINTYRELKNFDTDTYQHIDTCSGSAILFEDLLESYEIYMDCRDNISEHIIPMQSRHAANLAEETFG